MRVASNTSLNSTTDLRTDLRTAACHTTRIYRCARRFYASPILFRAPNVTQTDGQAAPMRGSLESVVILIKNRLKHVRKASRYAIDTRLIYTIGCQSEQVMLRVHFKHHSFTSHFIASILERKYDFIEIYVRSYNYFND